MSERTVRPGRRDGGDETGFIGVPVAGVTLLSILLMIAVAGLLLGRAAETWDSQVRHELEEDLIFRGEAYKAAIEEYQQANGHLPVKLEDLCPKEKADRRYIRKCWKDPITGKPLRLIGPGEPGQRRAANEAKRLAKEGAELLGGFADKARPSGDHASDGPALSDVKLGLPGQASKEQLEGGDKPIQGVGSDSDQQAFRTYLGSDTYSDWEFVAALGTQIPAVPGAGAPGVPPPGLPGGPSGVSGASGPLPFGTPIFGSSGATGPRPPGTSGFPGFPGGQQGFPGPSGFPGQQGFPGQTGFTGPAGPRPIGQR